MTNVRVLAPTEAAVMGDVAPGVFDHVIDARWCAEFFADPRHHLAVALLDGQVIGMASAVHYVHPDKAPELWVNEVGVAPPHQGQGIGKRLLQALFDHARSLGCREAWVLTDGANAHARKLYASAGGREETTVMVSFDLAAQRINPPASRVSSAMKIDGIKGCFEKTGGMFYFARMCSKIRLHAEGKLPEDYHDMLGLGFDGRTCRYLRVTYADVKAQVLSGKSDAEVLDWCSVNGRRLTEEEILIYNSFMSKRGWHDDETDEFIPEMIRKYGLPDNGTVLTDFDLIEMDEGRWHPDMWRDAWK